MSRAEAERLMFLRADLSSLKSEIARRSGLQDRALALYLVVVAFATLRVASSEGLLVIVPSVWVAAWLATNFLTREQLEIARLSSLLRDKVAKPAAALLGCQAGDLVPSEVWGDDTRLDPHTRALNRCFLLVSFLALPTALTSFALWTRYSAIRKLLEPHEPHVWLALVSAIAALHVVYMLVRVLLRRAGSSQ